MTLPGTTVTIADSAPARTLASDTGTTFMVGITERGPVDQAVLVQSLAQLVNNYGPRVSYGSLHDAAETFFREGGSRLYVGRIVGPSPVTASGDLDNSGSTATLTAKALSPGAWGNDIDVKVAAGTGGGTFTLTVEYDGGVVEQSGDLADNTEAVAWASKSRYIRLTDLAEGNPDSPQTVSLSGGDDKRGSITSDEVGVALDLFHRDLGSGQVLYPGATDTTSQALLLAHAEANRRVALLDGDNSPTVSDLLTDAGTLRASDLGRYGALFAPHATIPGITPGTTRTVGYAAVQAGIIARNDAAGLNPNVAAAGDNGIARWVIGLAQPAWSDSDREALNLAGVNVGIEKVGTVRTYGYRTLTSPDTDSSWTSLASARLAMAIAAQAEAIAEKYLFAQLDGRGHTQGEFASDLQGMLLPHYLADALFGASPEEAFVVDVGPGVNPPEDLAAGKLSAAISVRMSPFAERVEILITKVATEEAL